MQEMLLRPPGGTPPGGTPRGYPPGGDPPGALKAFLASPREKNPEKLHFFRKIRFYWFRVNKLPKMCKKVAFSDNSMSRETLDAIFGIYVKSAAQRCVREICSCSVALFPINFSETFLVAKGFIFHWIIVFLMDQSIRGGSRCHFRNLRKNAAQRWGRELCSSSVALFPGDDCWMFPMDKIFVQTLDFLEEDPDIRPSFSYLMFY